MFTFRLPAKQFIAAFDIDAQKTFTPVCPDPVCPDELPVAEGDKIVPELNAQAEFAALRVASRDAHSPYAKWIATPEHPCLSPIKGYPDLDLYWTKHAIVGSTGFDFIDGLDPEAYAFQSLKGIEPDKHPYGACYHDLANKRSTGVIEFLRQHGITTVICGGLATDYCVLNTVLQLKDAGRYRPRHHHSRFGKNESCRRHPGGKRGSVAKVTLRQVKETLITQRLLKSFYSS